MTLIRHMSMSVRVRLRTKAQPYLFRAAARLRNHCEVLEIVVDRIGLGSAGSEFWCIFCGLSSGTSSTPAHCRFEA